LCRGEVTRDRATAEFPSGDASDFDATQVDPASVPLGAGEASKVAATPFLADLDGDANNDEAFGFTMQDTGIVCWHLEVSLIGIYFY